VFSRWHKNNEYCDMMVAYFSRYSNQLGGWPTGKVEFNFLQRQEIFLFHTTSESSPRSTQPPIQRVIEHISPELNRPGPESDHSSSSSVDVINA
jgi:hypothetical protein